MRFGQACPVADGMGFQGDCLPLEHSLHPDEIHERRMQILAVGGEQKVSSVCGDVLAMSVSSRQKL